MWRGALHNSEETSEGAKEKEKVGCFLSLTAKVVQEECLGALLFAGHEVVGDGTLREDGRHMARGPEIDIEGTTLREALEDRINSHT